MGKEYCNSGKFPRTLRAVLRAFGVFLHTEEASKYREQSSIHRARCSNPTLLSLSLSQVHTNQLGISLKLRLRFSKSRAEPVILDF